MDLEASRAAKLYRVRLVQLSGKLLGEAELPATARVADILGAIQHEAKLDLLLKRTLVFQGRTLRDDEMLKELTLPSLPAEAEVHEILQPLHLEKAPVPPEGPGRVVHIGLVGQHGVGKTSLVLRYIDKYSRANLDYCRGSRVDFQTARVVADGALLKLILWHQNFISYRYQPAMPMQLAGKHVPRTEQDECHVQNCGLRINLGQVQFADGTML